MAVEEHDEQSPTFGREIELKKQLDALQGQITELCKAHVAAVENPELLSEVHNLKEKMDEPSKRLE